MVRDRDETETFDFQSETRSRPSHVSTRPRHLETMSRDRDIKTETTSLNKLRWEPEAWRHKTAAHPPHCVEQQKKKKLHAPDDGWNPAIFLVLLGGSKANRGINTNGPTGCQHTWSLVPPPPSYPTFLHWMLFLLQLSQLNLSWLEQALSYAGFSGLHTLSLGYDYNKIIFQIQPIYNLSMCILLLLHPFNGLFSRTTWISRH